MHGTAGEHAEQDRDGETAAIERSREAASQYLATESRFSRFWKGWSLIRAYNQRQPINPGTTQGENPYLAEGGSVAFLARKVLAEADATSGPVQEVGPELAESTEPTGFATELEL